MQPLHLQERLLRHQAVHGAKHDNWFAHTTHSACHLSDEGSRESVDARCKQLTASWVRERHISSQDIEVCDFYETLEAAGADAVLEPGVYTLQVCESDTFILVTELMCLNG